MRAVVLLPLAVALLLSVPLEHTFAQKPKNDIPEGCTLWKKHDCLKSVQVFEQDWACNGKYQLKASGVRLIGDTQMTSNFELVNKSNLKVAFTARQRHFYVKVCDEVLEFKAALRRENELYVIVIERAGKSLRFGREVNQKLIDLNAILLKDEQARRPSRITFWSKQAPGAFGLHDENGFQEVELRLLAVNGNVKLPQN